MTTVKWEVITNTTSALNILKSFDIEQPIFSDIEGDGINGPNRTIQLYQPETIDLVYIIDFDYVDEELFKQAFKSYWTIWHNASYDFGTLEMTTNKFDDTMYLARTAHPEFRKFSLDHIANSLGYDYLYSELDKKDIQTKGFVIGAYLSQKQLKYAATDVIALSLIWQDKKIQATREKLCYQVDILSLKYSIQYQQNGLIPNREAVKNELNKLEDDINANFIILNGLNCNSPKQVREFFGTKSSDKATLLRLIGTGDKIAKAVFDQRRLLKAKNMLESYDQDIVYTRFNPAGAVTGRFTANGKNLDNAINAQQIPRKYQYIFNMNTKDTVVVHADYSTAELRAGCSIMKDETMYEQLKAGIDLHRVAATFALVDKKPEEITKEERISGKAISFGFIFGMSAASFVEYAYMNFGVIFTEAEAKKIRDNYHKMYKQISQYAKYWWNHYKTEPVRTPMGRLNMANLGTDAINYGTQGGVGELMKLAAHYLIKEYPEAIKYIFNIVHDAGYLRVPKGDEVIWGERLGNAMIKAWPEYCKLDMMYYKDIPMPVEVEYTCSKTGKHIVKEMK